MSDQPIKSYLVPPKAPELVGVQEQAGTLTLVFSDPVLAGAGTLILRSAQGVHVFETAIGKSALSVSGNTVLVKLPAGVAYASDHTLEIDAGFVKTLEGIVFRGQAIDHVDAAQNPFPLNLSGGSGDDILTGSIGDDRFFGNAGDDVLTGGAGRDTAFFTGARASFEFTPGSMGTHTLAGVASGRDLITGIERLVFDDLVMALDSTAAQLYRMYRAAFDRMPDKAGLGYWIAMTDRGASLASVASNFVQSAEFTSLYGAAPTPEVLVDKMYEHVLHRAADAAGRAYWVDLLETHVLAPADVLSFFSESAENQAAVASIVGQGVEFTTYY